MQKGCHFIAPLQPFQQFLIVLLWTKICNNSPCYCNNHAQNCNGSLENRTWMKASDGSYYVQFSQFNLYICVNHQKFWMKNFLNSKLVVLTAILLRSPLLFAEVIEATMVSVLAALLIPSTRRPGATYEKPRNNSCAVALGGTPGESKKLKQNRH